MEELLEALRRIQDDSNIVGDSDDAWLYIEMLNDIHTTAVAVLEKHGQ